MATVTITTKPNTNRKECQSDPDPFRARRGETVTFEFKDFPDAEITFTNGSPFQDESGNEKKKLKPFSGDKVRNVPDNSKFVYTITWETSDGGGSGGGSGEVIGG